MDKIPWSVPVAVEDIPETGLHLEMSCYLNRWVKMRVAMSPAAVW